MSPSRLLGDPRYRAITDPSVSRALVGMNNDTEFARAMERFPVVLGRAETVAQALVARGVPAARLVTVGRQNAIGIAPTSGAQSANRRVEFELAFDGEPAR